MNKSEFLALVQEAIDTEDELSDDTELESIEEYDSLAVLGLMSMFDDMEVDVTPQQIEDSQKVSDLLKFAEDKISG